MIIKRIASIVLTIIVVAGALSEVFNYIGISPTRITNNRFISGFINFLNFKIPVYLVSLIVLITVFLYKYILANREQKQPLSVGDKTEGIRQDKTEEIKEDKIAETLFKEQKYLLLSLLEQSNKKRYRYMVADDYKNAFKRTTADFNIVEAQLKDLYLIHVRSGVQGYYWELTEKGLKVASIIHSRK